MSENPCKCCEACDSVARELSPLEDLARELFDIGAAAADEAGMPCWNFEQANLPQREAALAIARHVLKNFERRAKP